jgi:hypothetical protein
MSWINFKRDSNLVAEPFLKSTKSGGKGFFKKGDNPHSVLLGGVTIDPSLDTLWNYQKENFIRKVYLPLQETAKYTEGGDSYAPYGNLSPKQYPPYHQPRAKMFYD